MASVIFPDYVHDVETAKQFIIKDENSPMISVVNNSNLTHKEKEYALSYDNQRFYA